MEWVFQLGNCHYTLHVQESIQIAPCLYLPSSGHSLTFRSRLTTEQTMNSISKILCISVSDRNVSQISRHESLSPSSWKQSRNAGPVCLSNSKISILNSPLTSSTSGVINTPVSTMMYLPLCNLY